MLAILLISIVVIWFGVWGTIITSNKYMIYRNARKKLKD